MENEQKPVSQLVAQGWEIIDSSSCVDSMGRMVHSVLLRRHRQHRFVTISRKLLGGGVTVEERDV
ncbi:hypothetical protein [Devosia sediminis]|uniref:Uncharacterized protein n=1 Tax=Devosia sediminis TaxID=2798801 RepID=A0A934IXK9_9HYPH|nr:hypothetical protein [Devosia sediminis]MBJ3784085.1 hypothetical protein [Devosia sediminis]